MLHVKILHISFSSASLYLYTGPKPNKICQDFGRIRKIFICFITKSLFEPVTENPIELVNTESVHVVSLSSKRSETLEQSSPNPHLVHNVSDETNIFYLQRVKPLSCHSENLLVLGPKGALIGSIGAC